MDDRRWTNLTGARQGYLARDPRPDCLPHEAFLEVSARCNLRCRMCAIAHDTRYRSASGRPAMLEPEVFARLRPLFPTLLRAYLYGLGEPVLNRHLVAYVAELAAAGVEPWFTTNATLIRPDFAEAVARAGAHRVSVSLDGITPGTYESIRVGARFEDAMRGLRALCDARRRFGRPKVTVNVVAMAANLDELVELAATVTALGVEELNVEPLFAWQTSDELSRSYEHDSLGTVDERHARQVLAEVGRVARRGGAHFSSYLVATEGPMDYRRRVAQAPGPRTPAAAPCGEPWSTVFVTTAGEVRTCCLSDRVFGVLESAPIERIWGGDAFAAFRGGHADGTPPEGCESCAANGRARISPHLDAVEPVIHRPWRLRPPPGPLTGWSVDLPVDGQVLTDPLVITGTAPRAHLGRLPELAIDGRRVASLAEAVFDDGRFALRMDVPYLTEGVHLLSLVGASDVAPGGSRRSFRFRRPPQANGAVAVTDLAAIGVSGVVASNIVGVEVDGEPGAEATVLSGRTRDGAVTLVVLGVADLSPGPHALSLKTGSGDASSYRLLRLRT